MSIFSRSSTKETPATPPTDVAVPAAQAQGTADVRFAPPPPASPSPAPAPAATSRPAAPGVVPPPAAPLYSMRPAEDAESAVAEKVRLAREAQLRNKVRVTQQTTSNSAQVARRQSVQRAVPAPDPAKLPVRQSFDPLRAAQTGLLKLAWSWQKAGSPIRAIHAYMELLFRYPDSAAADAAVADLVALSDTLASEGQFHTALAIYDHLEKWATMEELA